MPSDIPGLSHLTIHLFFLLKNAIITKKKKKIKLLQGKSSISVEMLIKNIFALNLFSAQRRISQSKCHYLLELFHRRNLSSRQPQYRRAHAQPSTRSRCGRASSSGGCETWGSTKARAPHRDMSSFRRHIFL